MKANQKGFSVVEVILVLVVAALIGGLGFKLYNKHSKTAADKAAASNVSTTSTPKPATSSADTAPKGTVVKLSELGVQFTLPVNSLTDFKYVIANVDYSISGADKVTYPTAYLGTKQLDALGCPTTGAIGNAPPLGFLTKTPGQYPTHPTIDNTTGTLVKQYSDFYISYRSRGFACFVDDAKNQIVTTDNQHLQDALKSLEQVK